MDQFYNRIWRADRINFREPMLMASLLFVTYGTKLVLKCMDAYICLSVDFEFASIVIVFFFCYKLYNAILTVYFILCKNFEKIISLRTHLIRI
jgi:hypothetical protein